jgi:hypothetical protein
MEPTRVNIQYSIDLEELPSEVERMLNKAVDNIDEAAKEGSSLESHSDLLTIATLSKINDLRISLTKADLVLEDMVKIINGYLKMNMDARTPQEPTTQASPEIISSPNAPSRGFPQRQPIASGNPPGIDRPLAPPAPDFHELQEKLQKFADSIPDENPTEIAVD